MQLLADLEVDHILLFQLEDKILQSTKLLFLSHHIVVVSLLKGSTFICPEAEITTSQALLSGFSFILQFTLS